MIDLALSYALGCFGVALLLNLWRLMRGPTAGDRILALDTMVINMIALVVLYGLRTGGALSFEAALLLAMTSFVSTVAFARFLLRGNVIE